MPVCPTCGKTLDAQARFCPADGTPMSEREESAHPTASRPEPTPTPTPEPASSDPFVGRVLDGRYRILQLLGAGGMGAVYRAEHVQIHKTVAIKVLQGALAQDPEFRKRFEREAKAASRLSHPGCVSVIDFGRVGAVEPAQGAGELVGALYLVMEYVRGETLAERLKHAPMPPAEAILITRGVLSALRHAHGLGLIHRDIKPHNIMLCASDEATPLVKLLDFGLAKQVLDGEDDPAQPMTRVGIVLGTPAYVSPEQAIGGTLDARSDLYSLGVVLYEMVCGQTPFHGRPPEATMRAQITLDPPPPRSVKPALSPELEAVILKALSKDAAARHASAEEFQAALAACPEVAGRSAMMTATRPVAPVAPATRRPRLGWALGGGALVLCLAGVGGWVLRHLSSPEEPGSQVAAPPASAESPSAPAPASRAQYALSLVELGRSDEAIAVARAALQKDPHDGTARLALGAAYQSRLWCSDAIEEFEKAVREDPALRGDVHLVRRALACLKSKAASRTVRFLAELGEPATGLLRAATSDPDPEVRRGAERALERMAAQQP